MAHVTGIPCQLCGAPVYISPVGLTYKRCVDCLLAAGAVSLTQPSGKIEILYAATDALRPFHASTCPNLLAEGSRGTGKSHCMRWDAHMRSLAYAGYTYLILRRTMPELKKSHLHFIDGEMSKLGGFYHHTDNIAIYNNGSRGYFGHCETEADVMKYLSSQFCAIYFDEITTFDWDMVIKIAASARVPDGSGLLAIVRAGTNPLGQSAEEVQRYYITKDIEPEEDPEYDPGDWDSIHLTLDDNPFLDKDQYRKRFAGLPDAYRKAWLDGLWGVEGAYFTIRPDHVVQTIPTIALENEELPATRWPWMNIYRVLDWGWHDQTACIWFVILPDGREIAFKERYWTQTAVKTVATDIIRMSEDMRVVTTFADPTLWIGAKEMGHCLADEFETTGVPLTRSKNDRTACGYAIQEHLNTTVDEAPKLTFYEPGVPTLLRAMRAMRVDKKAPGRIDDHKLDHGPIATGYFCMASVGPTQVPHRSAIKPWMVPRHGKSRVLGANNVRHR